MIGRRFSPDFWQRLFLETPLRTKSSVEWEWKGVSPQLDETRARSFYPPIITCQNEFPPYSNFGGRAVHPSFSPRLIDEIEASPHCCFAAQIQTVEYWGIYGELDTKG